MNALIRATALGRCARVTVAAIGLMLGCGAVHGGVVEPGAAQTLASADLQPPGAQAPWQPVTLPDIRRSPASAAAEPRWYRIRFDAPQAQPGQPWAVYLPYFPGGGAVWLNGLHAWEVAENTPGTHVRWARPHLAALPAPLLRPGVNELLVRSARPPPGASTQMPRVAIGPVAELRPLYERRQFWVTTTPQITTAVCLLVALFVLFIWWRRRTEVLYGLFAVATALWGLRTLTFVIEVMPIELWLLWRLAYHASTGGFIVVMTILALRLGGMRKPWAERALGLYWLAGPIWLLAGGVAVEPLVNRYWIAGFLPIGMSIVAISVWTVWRKRTVESAVLPLALIVAVLAGLHDYFVNWNIGGAAQLLPGWAGHRIFLLHHGANVVLLAMGGLLTARFVGALHSLEDLNRTLEWRVADRERELAANYVRMAALQQQHAASQERQLIMRDLHDGLGSNLFVSLSRVERGEMQGREIADALRACIADMRLALDTLAPDDPDFRSTVGDFMFRWLGQLKAAGIQPAWTLDMPDGDPGISPHATLQVLRIAQEALTNVMKHSGASQVQVRLRQSGGMLEMEVEDDGSRAAAGAGSAGTGRGIANMRSRARQLGGTLEIRMDGRGTCVTLRLPANAVLA